MPIIQYSATCKSLCIRLDAGRIWTIFPPMHHPQEFLRSSPIVRLSLCPSVYVSVHLSVCLSISLCVRPSASLCVRPSACPSVCLHVCLSTSLFVRSRLCPTVCLPVCQCICLRAKPCDCMFVRASEGQYVSVVVTVYDKYTVVCTSVYPICFPQTRMADVLCIIFIAHIL